MGKRYDEEILKKYAQASKLENPDCYNLGNNYLDIIDIIKKTNNKNIYFLCSDIVKNNPKFVKFIIDYFKTDINFIIQVVNEYIVNNLTDNKEILDYMYDFMLSSSSSKNFDAWMNDLYNKTITDSPIKMNFMLIQCYYQNSKFILENFAKSMVNDIFKNISLEKKMHADFKNYMDLKEYGIRQYLYKIISESDEVLASYIKDKLYITYEAEEIIKRKCINWEQYETKYYTLKIQMYESEIRKFVGDNKVNLDSLIVIFHSVCKFNLNNIFNKYDNLENVIKEIYIYLEDINYNNLLENEKMVLDFSYSLIKSMFKREIDTNELESDEKNKKLIKE